ncbi:hypothetical protein [Amaricoccus solimangrovi]|uniref:hypothetical protein n=1 Tax=Amaricoccus solimangrovi TaxID=2589815 RepID=UPI0015E41A62|nr:hypothetical protein [Amaricoccus solimangrovi]
MPEQNKTELLRASIEEELGGFRHFADLPATEIEAMAARLVRVVNDIVGQSDMPESRAA